MIDRKSWAEFQNSGFLWWINTILHTFGWAIVLEVSKDEQEVISAYPARVKFRGFAERNNSEGYEKVSTFMADNAAELLKESKE